MNPTNDHSPTQSVNGQFPDESGPVVDALRRGAFLAPADLSATHRHTGSTAAAAAAAARRVADRAAAEGLADISYGSLDSPFGFLLAASTSKGLVRLAFPEEGIDPVLERLAQRLSPRIVESLAPLEGVRRELEEYFTGSRRAFDLMIDWSLVGVFGRRVLGAASEIPYGGVLSYAEIAAEAGSPGGSRAAGNALGSNPVPIVVPCHRVLRTGGTLGGYAGGAERKRWLLTLEGAIQTGR